MSKPLILVDGSSYLFRAFYALPNLTNSKGEPTGAILGVLNMLKRLRQSYDPTYAVVIFDSKSKNFRHELYPEYKANRAAMPDALRPQIAPIHDMIRLLGFPVVVIDGVEADDVIGTLAVQAVDHGQSVVISTGDKDMAQLVHEHVTIIDTMKNQVMDAAYALEKFGVPPKLMVDYLALVGDTSDNIPGIPGCGPKTAAKWLNEYGSLEQVIANKDKIGGKVGEALRAHLTQLPLARDLATIRCNVPIALSLENMRLGAPNYEKLRPLLMQYEFNSWLKAIEEVKAAPETPVVSSSVQYACILSLEAWQTYLAKLQKASLISIDTETTSLDAMHAELVGLSFALHPGEAVYVPLAHHYLDAPTQLSLTQVLADIKPILENPKVSKVGQNLKYDLKVLANYDIHLRGIGFDSMLASYVLDSGTSKHDLDTLALRHLNLNTIRYEDVAGKGAKQIPFSQVSIDVATQYAAEDADVALKLYHALSPRLATDPELHQLFNELELPMLSLLARIERCGVLINKHALAAHSQELTAKIISLEQQAYLEAGTQFNLNSPKQLLHILYEKMQIPVIKKTPTGQPSTAEEVLDELAQTYTLPKLILEHRHLSKLKSTYTDKLPLLIHPKTGRVHTSYHQGVAVTGRLSSSDPNLQNIPIKSVEGRKIRQAFIARPGYKIVAADYSQIELRIMAHLSHDPRLLEAFAQNEDIHRATAAEVFGVTREAVTQEQRRRAKAINFGLIYGMSPFGLAKQLGITREEAQHYVRVYFDRYPGVAHYMESTRVLAAEMGYVKTLFGRRLYLPDIKARNGALRKAAERAAINAPMQGTAADIIKRAMLQVDAWLAQANLKAHMIMQVHDELVFEVAEEEVAVLIAGVKQHMESAASLLVPLLVDVGIGNNWDEAH